MRGATPGGVARLGAAQSPETKAEDAITVAPGEENDIGTQERIANEVPDQPPSSKRPSRALKPSLKVREAIQSIEGVATTARSSAIEVTRSTAMRGIRALGGEKGANGQTETGKSPLQVLLERSASNGT